MSTPPKPHHLLAVVIVVFLLVPSPSLSKTVITHLPGFQGPSLPFYLETGYVKVDEVNGSELFYYFIESERNPQEDPVVLWLTGIPRCSALSALVFEIGPLKFVSAEYNGSLPNLVYHPYAWTKVASIIFLDSPVGSGFSFSRRFEGYDVGDVDWSKHAHKFLIEWFSDHPWFLANPLYITGDSYAGKIVPMVAHEISDAVEAGREPILNLKGYVIGNPVTGDKIDFNSRVAFSHGVGIISDQLYELIERSCEGQDHRTPSNVQCAEGLHAFYNLKSEIEEGHVLDPLCPVVSPRPKDLIHGRRSIVDDKYFEFFDPPVRPPLNCRFYTNYLIYYWANSNLTRDALGIKKGTVPEWVRCNEDLPYTKDIASNINYHINLTTRGYRALVYSGDHDLMVPFVGTQKWIRSLNFSIVDDWRSWKLYGQVAGYSIVYSNNLTFATVKNGGHTAPEYKDKECLAMFKRWISHRPL